MEINFDKTKARLAAIQILYAIELKGEFSDIIVEETIKDTEKYYDDLQSETQKPLNPKFLKRLVKLTVQNINKIDSIIMENLTERKTDTKINNLLRAILRAGICEIIDFKTPPKVIIDEYVKITKGFFNSEEVGFVNALLDKIIKKVSQHK